LTAFLLADFFICSDVGKRIEKFVPSSGETTIFVYDTSGKMVAEYSTIVESQSTAKVSYLTTDHLGSPRILTDANGNVTSRRDFHPFGEEIITAQRTQGLGYTADSVRQKFTGYERDIESSLDYTQARYYNSTQGRFTSTNPIFTSKEHPANPQRWNMYIYVINNPLNLTDPDGKKPKKIIDVFLTYETSKEVRTEWKQLQKEAAKNGVKINIYRIDNKPTTEQKFINSIMTKG
jgi:RHS repeat-associated protein